MREMRKAQSAVARTASRGSGTSWPDACPGRGRMTLTPMLSPRGRLIGDFTITCLGEERYQLTASYAAQNFHMRWFQTHLPKSGVGIRNMSLRRVGFQIAGPRARDLLSRVTTGDVSNAALPFLSAREMDVGLAPAIVCRVTYTGDVGYEIYVAPRYQLALHDALHEAGQDLGLRPFGMRAMMSGWRQLFLLLATIKSAVSTTSIRDL